MTETTEYPAWVCDGCGEKWGRRIPTACTMHMGHCGICQNFLTVTEPRDYGHLRPGWESAVVTR